MRGVTSRSASLVFGTLIACAGQIEDAADFPDVATCTLGSATNCGECGESTCLVFATRLAEGVKAVKDCPDLSKEAKQGLEDYLGRFHLED